MKKNHLVIREFNEKDLEQVLEIEENSFPPGQRYTGKIFIDYYLKYPKLFLVAEENGRVIGYVIGAYIEDLGHIVSIAVHPCCRGRGIGDKLLKMIEKKLIDLGVKYIVLEVAISNNIALKMYIKNGYQIARILYKYYGDEDAYLMIKQVK